MQKYSSDYFNLWELLLQRPAHCHTRYLQGRRALLLSLPATTELSMAYTKSQALKTIDPPPTPLTRPPRLMWMSLATTKLID